MHALDPRHRLGVGAGTTFEPSLRRASISNELLLAMDARKSDSGPSRGPVSMNVILRSETFLAGAREQRWSAGLGFTLF